MKFFQMFSSRRSPKSSRKSAFEKQITQRREKEQRHQETWGGLTRYYKTFETANNKYEEWTSPRYYETNNQMLLDSKRTREKAERLEERREKLKKLLQEEENSYQIELTVKNRDKLLTSRSKPDEIPTELLKEVNVALKIEDDDRKRHAAETALYHQWRTNNYTLREHERHLRNRDLKLSWLDQQIEKRMQKEREEEECKRILAERDERIKRMKIEEEQREKEIATRQKQLSEEIQKQIEEVKRRQVEGEELKKEEDERMRQQRILDELEEKRKLEATRRANYETALYNIRHYRMKLKQKALEVEKDLEYENDLIRQLQESRVAEALEEEAKRREIKQATEEFRKFIHAQKELEKKRQKYLDFVFDSEAKYMYEKQSEIWENERKAREMLLKDVMDTLKKQMQDKVNKNLEKQKQLLEERENSLKMIEQHNWELERIKQEEERRKEQRKCELEQQVKEKNAVKRKLKTLEQRNLDLQIQNTKKEEERLKKEILNLQKRQDNLGWARNSKRQLYLT